MKINLITYEIELRALSLMDNLSADEKLECKTRRVSTVLLPDLAIALAGTDAKLTADIDPELSTVTLETVQDAPTKWSQKFIDDSGNPGVVELSDSFIAKDNIPPGATGTFGAFTAKSERYVEVADPTPPAPPVEEPPAEEPPAEEPPAEEPPVEEPVVETPAPAAEGTGEVTPPAAEEPAAEESSDSEE